MTPETQGRNFLNNAPLGRQRNRITPDLELVAGFVRDARIITTRGVRPVQDISAGDLVNKLSKKHQVKILPIDSEQSAIFQLLVVV